MESYIGKSSLFRTIWETLYTLSDDTVLHCYFEMINHYWHSCLGAKPEWWVDGQIDDRKKPYCLPVFQFVDDNLGHKAMQRYMFVQYYKACSDDEFTAWWKAGVPNDCSFLDQGVEPLRSSGIS